MECQSFWVNIYQNRGLFSGNLKSWCTQNTFSSRNMAIQCRAWDTLTAKYIGTYKITLKPGLSLDEDKFNYNITLKTV